MEDFDYDRKFNEMQKYIPFLDRVIVKLKNDDPDKPRKAQLDKMQTLQNLLNNKQKKLKVETLLKCESVLKKLHAKIEQADDLKTPKMARKPSTSKTVNESSAVSEGDRQNESKGSFNRANPQSSSSASKVVEKKNDFDEINTCPASPTQFCEENFHPPVEIPTERKSSPVPSAKQWDQRHQHKEHLRQPPTSGYHTFTNRPNDRYQNHQQSTQERKKSHSRWSDPKDMHLNTSISNTSSCPRSWSSPSSSTSSSNNHRSYGQPRNEPSSTYDMPEEENWDDPEDVVVAPPKPASNPIAVHRSYSQPRNEPSATYNMPEEENWDDPEDVVAPPPKPVSNPIVAPPQPSPHSHHSKHHHHHHYDRPSKHRSNPNLIDIKLDNEEYQKKLFHDTIFKYKKPDPPAHNSNSFMNPQPPEQTSTPPTSVFSRLGESRSGRPFENFRIEVKNDKMKPVRHSRPMQSPQLQVPPPAIPIKPIDEVLKSPPLSADDLDDLMNETFEAATTKFIQKSTPAEVEVTNDRSALDVVRKKLAMISRSSPSERDISSPTSTTSAVDSGEKEPFYRRGHTPVKKIAEVKYNESPDNSVYSFKNALRLHPEPMPVPPVQPIENVTEERLALKYHPHRKCESLSETQNMFDIHDKVPNNNSLDPMTDRLALKYNPHPRKDQPPVSNTRVVDPRVGKILGHPSLVPQSIPVPAVAAPIPNVLPTINPYDPRLRNSRLTSMDAVTSAAFCPPLPTARSQIPNLLDMTVPNPLAPEVNKPPYSMTPRVDPRKQKPCTIYTDKFNPERNDQTERMKYLESKKKKAPEPKTYGEYKQCRQQAAEEAAKAAAKCTSNSVSPSIPTVPSIPSSLDKMYRSADYGKELGAGIHSFKIPKKAKPEPEPEPKVETVTKGGSESKVSEGTPPKQEISAEKTDEPKVVEKSTKKEENVKENESDTTTLNESKESIKQLIQEEKTVPKDTGVDATEKPIVKRRRGRPPLKARAPPAQLAPSDLQDDSKNDQEEEIKPLQVSSHRSTLLRDSPERDIDETDESTSATLTLTRSASDLFGPSTDNSIVSTQNIITGKRRTRASINFNEKNLKKTSTPKTTPTPSPATTPKPTGPKAAGRKSLQLSSTRTGRKQGTEKQTSDDGQICAVSSTTSQGGDESHNEDSNAPEDNGLLEEPSSSGTKPITADVEENQKKQEWLEGFLKSIVDPTTNKDRILDMLKAVLDEKKLEQVKNILYSPDDDSRNEPVDAKKSSSDTGKTRAPRTKKNELDRLNEDIRDMFICQGVVTATGRRMCTLAKETTKEKTPKTSSKESNSKEKKSRASAEPASKTPSRNTSPEQMVKRAMRKAKVVISPLNIRALRSRKKKDDRQPEMPVLEPNTPIKLSEEDDEDEEQDTEVIEPDLSLQKKKFGPKSKCHRKLNTDTDEEEDNIELAQLKRKVKAEDDIADPHKEEKKIEAEVEKNDGKVKEKTDTVLKEQIDSKLVDPIPKNTNPEWHAMSDYASCCVICKEKSRYIAPHYLTAHNDSEVYTSRLPPSVLEDLKNNTGNRALYSVPKKPNLTAYHYRCPFCDFQSTSTLRAWMEHFSIHTGEYQYKCSNCFKAMNGCTHLVEHIKKACPDAKRINREPVNLRGNMIAGFVCHLCNFVQMLHSGVVKHLKTHHGIEDEGSLGGIMKIKLIDTTDVPKMEEGKEQVEIKNTSASIETVSETREPVAPSESNMEVFLSRELASPTSDVLTERLKSIDQEDRMNTDSSVDVISPFKEAGGETPVVRMTIAERLSQRFKNIEKEQNQLEDTGVSSEVEQTEQNIQDDHQTSDGVPMEVDDTVPAEPTAFNTSMNESGNLIIDENPNNSATVDGNASESEWADDDDEDDNDNWEDIEITETKDTSQRDKSKNKSIFQTLSRLYASMAPKKNKRLKDREKRPEQSEQGTDASSASNTAALSTSNPSPTPETAETGPDQPVPIVSSESAAPVAVTESTSAPAPPSSVAQIPNISDLLPGSAEDSLEELLSTNFNCLDGYANSFPQLDLNDLDSPIFLLPEDQSNLQDAIAMATDLEHINHDDVLGNNLPPPTVQQVPSGSGAQRVGNFGFSLSGESLRYYCMVTDCTFLFSDHPDGLQNHFLLEHSTLQWDGYCHTCQAQTEEKREMQHILEVHSMAKLQQSSSERPRIKFRRLTGDILSTGSDQASPSAPSTTPPPKEQIPAAQSSEISLSTLLQSEPKAMIQPKPPTGLVADIPLYKNVSKEFAITSVVEGVTDSDLTNLVLNQSNSTPGGLQISQVISLNAGNNSQSPCVDQQMASLITFDQSDTTAHPESSSKSNSPTHPSKTSVRRTFNFKCCASKCSFSTSLRSAMSEHIECHMQTDHDREALKCHECSYVAPRINDYFQHMTFRHSGSTQGAPCQATNDLTQKIQDILRSNSLKSSEEEKDPLADDTNNEDFTQKLRTVAEERVAKTGTTDSETWKCPIFADCVDPISENDFLVHLSRHTAYANKSTTTSLKCPHCTVSYQRPTVLRAHMKTHSRHRFFCYLCCKTFASFPQTQKHINEAHTRCIQAHTQPLILDETTEEASFEIISAVPLSSLEVLQFGEKLIADWERKKASNKTHFWPQEHYLLPLQPIFNNQVFCSVCNYKTKVRTNMLRHLQLHRQEVNVASADPVNPVPCLEKNEKHFDKMLNLACSSNATGSGTAKSKENSGPVKIPAFVPDMRRFVCGQPGCTYLTITDCMLRSHLIALHSGAKGYQCPHCQEDICKKNMCAEKVVQHLRFHSSKIHQCGECDYLHYTKHVVERHIHDKHPIVPVVNLITHDRSETEVKKTMQQIAGKNAAPLTSNETYNAEPAPTTAAQPSNKLKWECALCKHQTVTWNQMISHTNSIHRAKHQYQCVHCPFGSHQVSQIMEHIDAKHPSKTREAKYIFYKINEAPQVKAIDTRPLWSRDDPKRVRNIRGILMENEEEAEITKRNLSQSGIDLDDDDDVEIIEVIEPESALKPDILSCFHCDFKCDEMSTLSSHWRSKHWHVKGNEPAVPKLPFFFRILSNLKCPLCPYIADYVLMQLHAFNQHGQRTFCASDPKNPNTCGHCSFMYPNKRVEILARHYNREHKPTDVKYLSSGLLRNVLALGECQVYLQCYFCAEIFADKTTIIQHERERHGSGILRYKQIKDEVIYRCAMCQYSSTNELATLRHMIDHFGGFKRCHFCMNDQTSFNAYMQHCYAAHPADLKNFKNIYPLADMKMFLGQMLLIFPNGLIVNKRNLVQTQYGSVERISAMYDEICKKALEPPIPPLCMARLMAKSLNENSDFSRPKSPSTGTVAKKIAKRRSTVAMAGEHENNLIHFTAPSEPQKIKKRKTSMSEETMSPAPLFTTIVPETQSEIEQPVTESGSASTEPVGVSYYGKPSEPIDFSKIYTQISIGDKFAPVSVKKFALLFKMNVKVVVDPVDLERYQRKRPKHFSKPCPASKKRKFEL